MKNIHILPTDNKYSRLYFNVNDTEFQICEIEKPSTILKPNRHICITSDEEIKKGDWFLSKEGIVHNNWEWNFGDKKIILTTDQDLIKDGVQDIDDEFLEWFVKNPSCEEVEVVNEQYTQNYHKDIWYNRHKLIIPKKEPKQDKIMERFITNAKQETLEEANNGLECEYYWKIECEYCHQTNGVHKMSCPTTKIQINL